MAETTLYFTIVDFLIFALMLAISACTALYFAIAKFRRQQFLADSDYHELSHDEEDEESITPLKGGLGIFVGFVSAITYLGIPAETYLNGVLFWSISLTVIPTALIINNGYLPIFYRLKLDNVFDYLEMRFSRNVRLVGVLGNFFNLLIYMTVIMYGLACALSAVTHVSLWGAILSIGLVRTIFTTVGGVNAILWVDLFQVVLMIAGFLGLIIGGSVEAGGVVQLWQNAMSGDRTYLFSFDVNPTTRHTTWSLIVGGIFLNLAFLGPNQMSIKKYKTALTESKAKKAVWIGMLLCGAFQILAVFAGIAMFSFYKHCDPLSSGQLKRSAELLPHFIVDMFSSVPGLPGLLVSAIFSASMSSSSAGIYSLALTTFDDFIKLRWKEMSPFKSTILIKSLSCFYGLLCMSGAFAISQVNSILQTVLSWAGILGGPVLGVFTLGFFSSRSNSKGAICGSLTGFAFGLWMFLGAYIYPPFYADPPLYTVGCYSNTTKVSPLIHTFNDGSHSRKFRDINEDVEFQTTIASEVKYPPIASLYAMSYLYYSGATWLITIVVGVFVSAVTAAPPKPDPLLLNPHLDICSCCRKDQPDQVDLLCDGEMKATIKYHRSASNLMQMETWQVQQELPESFAEQND
ncbi:putative sodium-coupled monocarboxylate transporter 1-like [Apostichopus japonicus]|uniref:Putative sodium-coupled monocarboxylate transporter 1-like n=1 Tax=Stichopus japonicus TaxID=307972 RepID=A0A2G8K2N5_STIJA|nr:putative sodium-coupled monocarboxylate transporter 1-like [Apostichopus japonicus]